MSLTPKTPIPEGAIRYNTDSNKMEVWIGDKWMQVAVSSPNLDGGARAIRAGGQVGGSPYPRTDTMDFVTIPTAGNATDFGNLTQVKFGPAGAGSRTRAVFMAGGTPTRLSEIDFVTFSSTGNAADFGDMTGARAAGGAAGHSSETRAILAGGTTPSTDQDDTIDFITIASTGDGKDFGNLTQAVSGILASGSSTRGLLAGGSYLPAYAYRNTIDMVTIATTGNAQEFGDLNTVGNGKCCDNSTRVLFQVAGGDNKQIETVTISTLGNSIKFGELTQTSDGGSFATSDPTRGLFGLNTPSGGTNIMEYISMSTGGTAVDFGDLTQAITNSGGTSNAHGGL
tara:strand:+ start:972 stop:1991 length:1020 start_codon:yes stop_codon:yes gene_type:complete